ncbi:hypothetical protein LPB140_02765 [Sphingorhabdus lutea]|uniref:Uncharacterized protein n=1 Tax=Sphingorhabdus lutea TaxID=1913578 RepID=A0A1L3J9X3_9SPHN|nr:hypothetical protein [Sphingorhabdus lutea]APG61924.1 hypothetical protein LPB140_02765 [Sphingorhabdus lutea]
MKRKFITLMALSFFGFAALNNGSGAYAHNMAQDEFVISKAEAAMAEKALFSFSTYAWEAKFEDIKEDLTIVQGPECHSMADYRNDCGFFDQNMVEHYFWDDDMILVVKSVSTKNFNGKEIRALGIGKARDKDNVVANVQKFLPDAKMTCLSADEAGQGDGISSCGAEMGEGWFTLLFDSNNQLISARMDAYHFT